MSDLRAAWRKRAAIVLRRFRAKRGRWPHPSVVRAMHRGMEQVIRQGIKPPIEH